MSDSKRMKNDSSTSTDDNKISLLPEDVQAILQTGMKEGFDDGDLNLRSIYINDSMMPELCEWVVKLEDKQINEHELNSLYGNQITSVGAAMLFDMLRATNSSIKQIHLYQNKQINDKCMTSLGEYFNSNKYIERRGLYYNTISDAGIEILVPYLDSNATFKRFYISGNKEITDKSIPLLLSMIESSNIEDIDVSRTSITQENIIIERLASNQIKGGWSGLSLRDNLHGNEITSKGASILFDALRECNSNVSKLYLSWNEIDDKCMKQLGEYIQDNEHIDVLRLGYNKITDKGVEMLSEYLIGNATLKELSLYHNTGITDESISFLIEIAKKTCISIISIDDTSISEENGHGIEEALTIPIDQREVPIKSNTKSFM